MSEAMLQLPPLTLLPRVTRLSKIIPQLIWLYTHSPSNIDLLTWQNKSCLLRIIILPCIQIFILLCVNFLVQGFHKVFEPYAVSLLWLMPLISPSPDMDNQANRNIQLKTFPGSEPCQCPFQTFWRTLYIELQFRAQTSQNGENIEGSPPPSPKLVMKWVLRSEGSLLLARC